MPVLSAALRQIGQPIARNYLGMQRGDVPATWADRSKQGTRKYLTTPTNILADTSWALA
jgi:hypothetical protein